METADACNAMERDKAVSGIVFGVGVGPGDPDLLTIKASRLIAQASVIAYPVQGGNSLARSIVTTLIPPEATEIAIDTPMGEKGAAQPGYRKAVGDMLPYLEAGRDVVVLCEGDPLFYGSFMYVMEALGGRYPVEVIPGVSSLTACAAAACWPLVGRNERLVALSALVDDDDLRQGLALADIAVIFKVGRHLPRLHRLLMSLGLAETTLYIEKATLPTQRIVPLPDIADGVGAYFSVLLVRRTSGMDLSEKGVP